MKNAEMKVVSFGMNDVITTSLACTNTSKHFYSTGYYFNTETNKYALVGSTYSNTEGDGNLTLDDSDKIIYSDKFNVDGLGLTTYMGADFQNKWYVLSGTKYVFCDDDHTILPDPQ